MIAVCVVGRSIPQGYLSKSHIFLIVPIIFYAIIMYLLKGSGRLKLSGHLILGVQFSMVIGGIILSGGDSSIVLFYLGVMIIFAFLFVGPVHGAVWALILAATHIAFISVRTLELDKFKPINDQLGHDAGDVACRFGGDEFAVLFQHVSRVEDAVTAVTHVIQAIERPIELNDRTVTVGASAGVALLPAHAADTEALLDLADRRMYIAKRGGARCCVSEQ